MFNVLIELFKHVGLHTNSTKKKMMICVPGKIRVQLSQHMYESSLEGLTSHRDRGERRVKCDVCGDFFAAGSLTHHLETQHDIYRSRVICKDLLVDREPVLYKAHSGVLGTFTCPVPGCIGELKEKWNLRQHFLVRHP